MKHNAHQLFIHKALLASTLTLFIVAPGPANAVPNEEADATVTVTFSAPNPGMPGTWHFSPRLVALGPGQDTVQYNLDRDSIKAGWGFRHIAIGENLPGLTDYIEIDSAESPVLQQGDWSVSIVNFSPRSISVKFGGVDQDIEFGLLLTVISKHGVKHTCRDPQIVLDREDDPPVVPEG